MESRASSLRVDMLPFSFVLCLRVTISVREHAAVAVKDRARFHRERCSGDITIDYRSRTQLNAFEGRNVSVNRAAYDRRANFYVGINSRLSRNNQSTFLRDHF